jgi:hypothetical protein
VKNSIKRDIHLLESYAGMTHKMNDNQGRPKLDQAIEHILSDYKRVLKENEQLNKKVDLMENYMVENGWEICFDNIYAELNNCNGMERDWCRGDKLEKQDIHKYFSKKLLESEE